MEWNYSIKCVLSSCSAQLDRTVCLLLPFIGLHSSFFSLFSLCVVVGVMTVTITSMNQQKNNGNTKLTFHLIYNNFNANIIETRAKGQGEQLSPKNMNPPSPLTGQHQMESNGGRRRGRRRRWKKSADKYRFVPRWTGTRGLDRKKYRVIQFPWFVRMYLLSAMWAGSGRMGGGR